MVSFGASEWYFSWCMQLQESQEMNREEIKKKRETITLLKYVVERGDLLQ